MLDEIDLFDVDLRHFVMRLIGMFDCEYMPPFAGLLNFVWGYGSKCWQGDTVEGRCMRFATRLTGMVDYEHM